jgi:hypothetical protein
MILKFNQWFNSWRARAGLPYWSLSQYLKSKVKNAVNYITSFEDALADEAKKKGLDGVICGHIHKPEIRDIGGVSTATTATGSRACRRWWKTRRRAAPGDLAGNHATQARRQGSPHGRTRTGDGLRRQAALKF